MTSEPKLAELSLLGFAKKLGERTATPGGGSVAAYLVTLGAALTTMAMRFTSGEKYAALEPRLRPQLDRLAELEREASELIDADSAAYDAVTAAYKLPKASDAEKAARSAAVQEALTGAMRVPLRTMQLAVEVLRIASGAIAELNPNLTSDCAAGALCAWSGVESAYLNVKINAKSIRDAALAESTLAASASLRSEADRALARVREVAKTNLE